MKRNFFLAIEAMRKFADRTPEDLVEIIFPFSDVREHLVDRMITHRVRQLHHNFHVALCDFYVSIDDQHQRWFDEWANAEIEKTDSRTVQYKDNIFPG
jgi:hypothetical protein